MTSRRWRAIAGILAAGAIALALSGCSAGEALLAYTGGGLPPGDPDLGGVVVASVDGETSTAQDVPPGAEGIEGATVTLMRGQRVVGRATTGEGGYFRFQEPATGNYTVVADPPANRQDLQRAQRSVSHTGGQRTFVTIELPHAEQGEGAPGPGR